MPVKSELSIVSVEDVGESVVVVAAVTASTEGTGRGMFHVGNLDVGTIAYCKVVV